MYFITNRVKFGKTTRITHNDGRDYLVAPVVAIVAGVLNGELVPTDEIGHFPDAWNGIPVPLGHPTQRGSFVSANSPELVTKAVGRFWNARMDGDALKGEIWIDVERAQQMGGDALEALQRLEQGQPIEVSTAYFRDLEEAPGEFNGVKYSGIAHNLRPDHLALLLNQVGACSWKDGCGAPRVNQEENVVDHTKLVIHQEPPGHTGVMVALYPPAADATALAISGEGLPSGSVITPANQIHLTLIYLGEIDEMRIDQMSLLEAVMRFAENSVIVHGLVSGIGRFNGDHGNGMQPIYASIDSEMLQAFRFWLADRMPYPAGGHGFTPHITLTYIPMDAATPNFLPEPREIVFDRIGVAWGDQVTMFQLQGMPADVASNQKGLSAFVRDAFRNLAKALGIKVAEEPQTNSTSSGATDGGQTQTEEVSTMEKKQLIEKLAANSRCPFDKTDLEAMSDAALVKLEKALDAGGCAGGQPAVNNQIGASEDVKVLQTAVTALTQKVEGVLGELQANKDLAKAELVAELKANERCAFEEAELQVMSLEQLKKLAASLSPANYVGRGGVRGNTAKKEPAVPEPPAIVLAKPDQAK